MLFIASWNKFDIAFRPLFSHIFFSGTSADGLGGSDLEMRLNCGSQVEWNIHYPFMIYCRIQPRSCMPTCKLRLAAFPCTAHFCFLCICPWCVLPFEVNINISIHCLCPHALMAEMCPVRKYVHADEHAYAHTLCKMHKMQLPLLCTRLLNHCSGQKG